MTEREDILRGLDTELAAISGLNDLLTGVAPATVAASGKAINALVANYEAGVLSRNQALAALTEVHDTVVPPMLPETPPRPGSPADIEAAKRLLGDKYVDPELLAERMQMQAQLLAAMRQLKGEGVQGTPIAIVHPDTAAKLGKLL